MDLTQAFSLLKSLQQNLPHEFAAEKKWVDDFHSILDGELAHLSPPFGDTTTTEAAPPIALFDGWEARTPI